MEGKKWYVGVGSIIILLWLFYIVFQKSGKVNMFRKQIVLPDDLVFTKCLTDTVEMKFNGLKIVRYIDSLSCYGCELKERTSGEFICLIDSISHGSVPYIVYVHPYNRKSMRIIMHRDKIDFPICFDENDVFRKLNEFSPQEKVFCLLDSNNNVLVWGNPIHNRALCSLYVKTICERLGIDAENATKKSGEDVEAFRYRHDFGLFDMREEQRTSFALYGTGRVDSVYTSCECTTASVENGDLSCGDSITVNVVYKADAEGSFMREVYVMTEGRDEPVVMTIEGEAVKE